MSLGPSGGPSSRDHGVARDHPVPLVLGVLTLLLQQDKTRRGLDPVEKKDRENLLGLDLVEN